MSRPSRYPRSAAGLPIRRTPATRPVLPEAPEHSPRRAAPNLLQTLTTDPDACRCHPDWCVCGVPEYLLIPGASTILTHHHEDPEHPGTCVCLRGVSRPARCSYYDMGVVWRDKGAVDRRTRPPRHAR